jgi:hypothetical protein
MKSDVSRRLRFMWRTFDGRDGNRINQDLYEGRHPCCPCCGECLEARPHTRLARCLPLDASGYDLDCRGCRRFHSVVRHTGRSIRLVRMRRLIAAVRAAGAMTIRGNRMANEQVA